MNFKDFVPALAMLIPTVLLITAAAISCADLLKPNPMTDAARYSAVCRPAFAVLPTGGSASGA